MVRLLPPRAGALRAARPGLRGLRHGARRRDGVVGVAHHAARGPPRSHCLKAHSFEQQLLLLLLGHLVGVEPLRGLGDLALDRGAVLRLNPVLEKNFSSLMELRRPGVTRGARATPRTEKQNLIEQNQILLRFCASKDT